MGKDKIFLIRDGELQEMQKEKYDEEQTLQRQIKDHTGLIPGEQIDPDTPRRWLMIEREAGIQDEEDAGNRWSVDHLLLDQDGIPTLIEVKRQQDTRGRRRVVAQMLDYAANTSRYWTVETIKERFRAGVENPDEDLSAFLDGKASNDEFWEDVETNLERGKCRLLFVADDISSELKSIVEFLNDQMEPAEVLAVELGHYEGQGEEALVPRVLGQTEAARQKKGSSQTGPPRTPWNEENFFKELESNIGSDALAAMKKVYELSVKQSKTVNFGDRSTTGSVNMIYPDFPKERTVYTLYGDGGIILYFWFDEETNQKLREIYSRVPGLDITPDDNRERVGTNIKDLEPHLKEFLNALKRVKEHNSVNK